MQESVHGELKNLLARVIKNNKVAHTYLFYGPEGVGKTEVAEFFARSLLCPDTRDGSACGECLACRKAAGNNHPDLLLLSPMGASFRIEQVRELQRILQLKPFEGGRRVVIIKGAEVLTQAAANSLLKTLEEPPQGTVFILLSRNPYSLPSTVLSRSQVLKINSLPPERLSEILTAEGTDSEEAKLISFLAGGILGRAREMVSGEWYKQLQQKVFIAWDKICTGRSTELLQLADELEKEKEIINPFLEILVLWIRDVLVWQKAGSIELLFHRNHVEKIKQIGDKYKNSNLPGLLEALEEAKKNLQAHGNVRLVLESLFLQMKCLVA